MSTPQKVTRCAVYTRKSSEEGLEQSFNSLDAQREACDAYVLSQRHEGWRVLPARYDDGGFSGGSMERPALKRLMADIGAGKIDTIVVYKVDRLTRSLADFAKIVETLDAHAVSFVSVTQQFNTTTSMGRLTLNILLSFAQFEREVTGERIRDKIAASKRKGMWMGGNIPLGYDLKDRKLVVNVEESKLLKRIFAGYLADGCVSRLKARLDREGVKSKIRIAANGKSYGGRRYSRGALYHILRRRLYLGEIPHRGQIHAGEHEAIVSRELWDKVQARLGSDHQGRKNGVRSEKASLLIGLLQDIDGHRFTPSHSLKNHKRYRYYVSQRTLQNPGVPQHGLTRLPAHEIEARVAERISAFLASQDKVAQQLASEEDEPLLAKRIVMASKSLELKWRGQTLPEKYESIRQFTKVVLVHEDGIEIRIGKAQLRKYLLDKDDVPHEVVSNMTNDLFCLSMPITLQRSGREVRMIAPLSSRPTLQPQQTIAMLKAIARAHDWKERLINGEVTSLRALAKETDLDERYVSRILGYAFLAPQIVTAILDGRQLPKLTLERLRQRIPIAWQDQCKLIGLES